MRIYIQLVLVAFVSCSPLLADVPAVQVIESRPGNVNFLHASHGSIKCGQCHHDTSPGKQIVACRVCHTKTATGKMNSKYIFHKSCIGCHEKKKREQSKAGPVKLCSQCHSAK